MSQKRPALFGGRHFEAVIIILCVRWYLRYSLSQRDLGEIMAERGLAVDHVTIWRWVQRYVRVLNQRIRRELRHPNRSWRGDETYVRVAGNWRYLYRADSAGEMIGFMLSPKRDLTAATLFLRLWLSASSGIRLRVINVNGHPACARAITELKHSGELSWSCHCRRTSPYLNNLIEQGHRFIKKRITASLGSRSVEAAWRTIDGYEAMHAIRKGQIRWLAKGDAVGQRQFIHTLLGIVV
jgi:transposase-like protein